MDGKRPLFSVVIPVYNVEAYLAETVDSVIGQTIGFKDNIEIILVNDGSPDNSGEICEKYRDMYPDNIKYVVKENGGVSSARNVGFEYATGEYVNFLDSDDVWAPDAFEKAYDFYCRHGEEIDVIASRIQFFDAKEGWHVLDYKYNRGTRVLDLTKDSDCNHVQLHVTSAFVRRSAVKDYRFDEKIKFGEDALFISAVILDKMKYGVIDDCIFMYRKRQDESSATQGQKFKRDYYTVSPRLYYNGMIEESMKRFGTVVPYVQNILAYDIGWRAKTTIPDEFLQDKELCDGYMQFLRETLSVVDDTVYLRSVVHRRLGIKCAFYKLKHEGRELVERTRFDLPMKSVFVDDVRLYNFNKINHMGCIFNLLEINGNTLNVEGVVSRWLLSSCPEAKLSFALRMGDKVYRPEISDFNFAKEVSIFGDELRYYLFRQQIDLSDIPVGGEVKLCAALTVGDELCDITARFGKHIPDSFVFEPCFKVQGDYIVTCTENAVTLKRSANLRRESKKLEKAAQRWLKKNELEDFARFRKDVLKLKKKQFRNKKLWLITDRFDKASDNAEAFFRYLSEKKDMDKSIVPVFAISRESEDARKLEALGRVIYFEDEDMYKKYFLCADKIITSSGGEFAVNPLAGAERIYLTDMINSKLVFLQHGIIYNNLSAWLQKHNKNIKLFITSAKGERDSIAGGDYLYTDKEVKLTGLARYDLLEDRREKKVVVIPTWRTSIKESYNEKTESVYFDGFRETDYFKFYNSLINNERLLSKMREKGYKGLFCLHPIHSKQSVDFSGNDVFAVNEGFVDYRNVFSTSALMVTDYSSVFFDFSYLRKPVIYAQFDREEFYEAQNYEEGYFTHERDGFGPVCYDIDSTVDAMIALLERDCVIEDKYLERIEGFYGFNDKNNCERIYNAIVEMD